MSTHRDGARRASLQGVLLGVAMAASNVLSYAFVVLLSRSLGPADFGGYSALATYGILLAVPAGAFQVVVARRMSVAPGPERTSGWRTALVAGAMLAALTCLASPWLAQLFRLPSALSVVLLGLSLLPLTLTGACQGVLLGTERLRALASLYVVTAAARLVAAGVAALAGFGVTAVFAVLLAASVVAVGWGWWLTRRELASTPSSAPGLVAVLLRSNGTLAAFIALTNVDVLLARNFLTEHDSGGYALAATFARGMCWLTQFLALLVVPRMQRTDAARSLLVACGLVVALGMSVLALVSVSPRLWIEVAGGSSYVEFAPLVLWCVALGTAWSLAQVWLFAEMGGSSTAMGLLTWAVLAGECVAVAVWWHDSPEQILGVALVGALVIAATGLVRALLSHREVRLDERSVVAATDGPRT